MLGVEPAYLARGVGRAGLPPLDEYLRLTGLVREDLIPVVEKLVQELPSGE